MKVIENEIYFFQNICLHLAGFVWTEMNMQLTEDSGLTPILLILFLFLILLQIYEVPKIECIGHYRSSSCCILSRTYFADHTITMTFFYKIFILNNPHIKFTVRFTDLGKLNLLMVVQF